MKLEITVIFVIVIICIILYLFLGYKQYEGMSGSGCSIIGNPGYDSYCQSNKAVVNNSCESKCSTTVPGLGSVCCQSSCCLDNKPSPSQNNDQILNDIQSLQQFEKELFNTLETNTQLTPDKQQQLVAKINQISNMRINLYQTLSSVNQFFENSLSSSVGTLKEQTVAIGIVESELNRAKKRLEILEAEKNNKIRLVEINNYYGDKYAEHSQLMKIIIFTLVPIIIISVLYNKNMLPDIVYKFLLIIITIIGSVYFWRCYSSIIKRDNMNYQEYDWQFNASTASTGTTITTTGSDPWASTSSSLGTCIGQSCCSTGQTYDSTLNQCVITPATTAPATTATATTATATTATATTTESFAVSESIDSILTKKQHNKYKDDYNMRQNYDAHSSKNLIHKS